MTAAPANVAQPTGDLRAVSCLFHFPGGVLGFLCPCLLYERSAFQVHRREAGTARCQMCARQGWPRDPRYVQLDTQLWRFGGREKK